jgi:hypothetical protein
MLTQRAYQLRRGLQFLSLALGLIVLPLQAQNAISSGAIAGRVTDKTGALVVGATVTLTNVQTGIARTAPSNKAGLYNFALVPPGTYVVSATKSGFAKAHSAPAQIQVGQTVTIDFSMQPGSQTQTVEVSSAAPLVNSAETGVASNISPTQVKNLPLNGNDLGSLAVLAPGVTPVNPYDPTKSRVATFAVDGSTGRNVNATVNGVEDKDNSVGGPVMQLPLNAIQEFQISPQRFSAANGRSEGAAMNIVEKQGTNQFHGGAQFYFTNTGLNANDYFSKQSGGSTPQFDRQQEGADIGGPIRKNKDFFFFAFYHDNEKTSIPVTAAAQAELTLAKPIGAQPLAVVPTPYHDNRYALRLDHTINSNNTLTFNFNWQNNYGLNDQDGNNVDATENNFTKNALILGGLTWNTIISPTVVNAFTAGYQYWNNVIDTNQVTPFSVSFPDGTSFGTNGNVPQNTTQKKWEFRDDFSILHGNHSLKFGEDLVWDPFLGGFFKFNEVPSLSFTDPASVILSNTTTYPEGFATPGAVTSMSLTAGDPYYIATGGTKSLGLYAEDDWQATNRLTLNLGVRYERDTNTYGENDEAKNRTYLALKAIGSPYAASLPTTDNGDLAPVLGFTYDLTGHHDQLLRGGFGMYYGQTFQNIPLFALQQADPSLFLTVYNVSLGGVGQACTNCNVPGTNIPLSQWRLGVDPNPVWTAGAPTQIPAGGTGQLIDPNYRNPVSEQFNLGYTWAMNSTNAINVDYIHELGLHEAQYVNINPIINKTRVLASAFANAGVTPLGSITVAESTGRSRYDALEIQWTRRMDRNFSINTSYTLSRALAWGGSAASFGNRPATLNQWDPVNFGPTGTDQRHRVVFSGIFNGPWGINVEPIMQWASAPPYTGSMGSDIFGYGPGFAQPHAFVPNNAPTDYTAYVLDSSGKALPGSQVTANVEACLAANACHELPINFLRGQSFFELDSRFGKRVAINDKVSLNLFFQAFDLTNRANFGSGFNGNLRSSSFGQAIRYITPSGVAIPKAFRGEFGAEISF